MLEELIVGGAFAFLLVFARIGSAVMLLPGFGEVFVPARMRLTIALLISLMMLPLVQPLIPPNPASPLMLTTLLIAEIMTGLFIGGLSRIMISTLHVAGTTIAFQSSLSAANMFDYTQASQGTMIGNFMSIAGVTLLFASNLHHVMLKGILDSYTLFTPGMFPPVEDFSNYAVTLASKSFMIGISIAAPHLVIGLMLYLGAGVLSRLMPTMQVFFVIIPVQIAGSFFIMMATISGVMLWYLGYYADTLGSFLSPK